jgi:hypothetical protein
MGVINDPWQGSYSKAEQNCHEKMLLERKDVSDFEQVLKEIYFRNPGTHADEVPASCA